MTLVVWLRLAEVPVTVMVKAPCGVPGCVGGGLVGGGFVAELLELEVLPPHEVHSNASGRTTPAVKRTRLPGIRASLQRITQTRREAKSLARSFAVGGGGTNRCGAMGGNEECAVVVRVTLATAGLVPSRVSCVGEIEQVVRAGAPLQVSDTVPLNPPTGVTEAE